MLLECMTEAWQTLAPWTNYLRNESTSQALRWKLSTDLELHVQDYEKMERAMPGGRDAPAQHAWACVYRLLGVFLCFYPPPRLKLE